jgi:hypothetical protein
MQLFPLPDRPFANALAVLCAFATLCSFALTQLLLQLFLQFFAP